MRRDSCTKSAAWHISPGERWDSSIQTALNRCQYSVAILSPRSVTSDNVLDEINHAVSQGKRVVPVLIEDCEIPHLMARRRVVDCRGRSMDKAGKAVAVELEKLGYPLIVPLNTSLWLDADTSPPPPDYQFLPLRITEYEARVAYHSLPSNMRRVIEPQQVLEIIEIKAEYESETMEQDEELDDDAMAAYVLERASEPSGPGLGTRQIKAVLQAAEVYSNLLGAAGDAE